MKFVLVCLLTLLSIDLSLANVRPSDFSRSAISLVHSNHYGILGGKPAKINKYPYVVSITYNPLRYLIGSGAIVDKEWIVCSAFQVADINASEITIRAGSSEVNSGGQHLNISKIIVHENYVRDYAYDVALLKTSNAIKVGKTAKAIKLAKSTPKQGTQAKIVGYGMYMNETLVSGQLQVASVQVKSKQFCQAKHGDLDDTCFCADADDVSPCYGDFGDPLVRNNQLIGCYLGGDVCNIYGLPEIYSNIAELQKWILAKIKENKRL